MSGDVVSIHCCTDVSPHEWNAYVDAHPAASAYHAWQWREVFAGAFGHEPLWLAARRGAEIAGVLPTVVFRSWLFGRFMVSLPFVNYGGVLADDANVAGELLAAASREAKARRCAHIEMRHVARQFPELPVKQHKVAMTMALPASVDAAWSAVDRKARNQVRKAQKSNLDIEWGGRELIPAFYQVFAVNMRDLGTPVYSRRFFEHVVNVFPERTAVALVRNEGRAVAGAITVRYRDRIEVPWASSLRDYRASCPNNLLYWAVIERAIAQGCTTLDFGRSTPGEGTFEFKRQWGAEPSPLFWEYALASRRGVPDVTLANPRFGAAIAVWKRLPLPVTTVVGPSIVRSIP
jgi:FemAB-related protein (PEP-CTERM system-associated)